MVVEQLVEDFEPPMMSDGIMLCMMCILLWCLGSNRDTDLIGWMQAGLQM